MGSPFSNPLALADVFGPLIEHQVQRKRLALDQQQQQERDAALYQQLLQAGKPVQDGGVVEDLVDTPAGKVPFLRKADQKRIVQTPSGRAVELYSEEDAKKRVNDQLQELLAQKDLTAAADLRNKIAEISGVGEATTANKINERERMVTEFGVETPLGRVLLNELGGVASYQTALNRPEPQNVPLPKWITDTLELQEGASVPVGQLAESVRAANDRIQQQRLEKFGGRIPVPGTDVPLPADVEAQRGRIAAAGASAQRERANEQDAKDIAQGIIDGLQPPDLRGLYSRGIGVRAELQRKGYDLTTAQRDWTAVQRHMATLNGTQQERLRQAIAFTSESLGQIEQLYEEWQKVAPTAGLKVFNKAALAAAKQLPGKPGEVATNLEAQINDLTSELGTVYKGGNASTDESLRLAAGNLSADWNEQTFKRAIGQIRTNLAIRRNSILTSEPAGLSPNSPYANSAAPSPTTAAPAQPSAPPPASLLKEGIPTQVRNKRTGETQYWMLQNGQPVQVNPNAPAPTR